MSATATLPLPLALTPPQPVEEGSRSLEEVHYRVYTSVYTKYNPETQVRETSDGVPAPPRMEKTNTYYPDTWDDYHDDGYGDGDGDGGS